jgi:putative ABC transport system permease protein
LTDGRAELDRLAARIESGHRQAVGALSAAYPDKTRLELVENPPPDFFARVRAEKFEVEDVHALADFARRTRALSAVEQALLEPEIRSRLARATGLAPSEIELSTVASYVRKRESNAASVAEVLRGAGARGLDGPRLYDLLSRYERERRLDRASSGYVPNPSAFFGLGARTQWLIVLSFLVCVVGVANAMLMSVTERFTEIATMKCLGALDGFVMTMFVFEALIQGAVGGVVGVVLGVLLAVVRMLFEYGPIAGAAFGAVGEMGSAALLALVIGVLLAAVAAVGPSFVAARLAPMEAMRVD